MMYKGVAFMVKKTRAHLVKMFKAISYRAAYIIIQLITYPDSPLSLGVANFP